MDGDNSPPINQEIDDVKVHEKTFHHLLKNPLKGGLNFAFNYLLIFNFNLQRIWTSEG
jgi:hypothetical protein